MGKIKPLKLKEGSFFTVLATKYGKEGNRSRIFVEVRCICGTIKEYPKNQITTGPTLSCGCSSRKTSFVHGYSKHTLYNTWINMINRCYKSSHDHYYMYGGKGIIVCDEWKNDVMAFINWALSNGWQKGLTIDRKIGTQNYTPDNCRFVTQQVNNNNRSNNRLLTYNGKTQTVADWARELGLVQATIRSRLNRNKWSVEKTLSTP